MRKIIRIARLFNTMLPLALAGLIVVFGGWIIFGESFKAIIEPEKILGFRVDGTPMEVFELRPARFSSASDVVILKYVKRKEKLGYGEDWSGDIRNLLFIGPGDSGAKWLFPDETLHLVDVREWPDKNASIKAMSIVARNVDRESRDNRVSVYVVKADGGGLKRVLTEVEEIMGQSYHNEHLRIVYREGFILKSIKLSVRDWGNVKKSVLLNLLP